MRLPVSKRLILIVVGMGLGGAALLFGSVNRDPVHVDFYFGEPLVMPLWVLVLATLGLGWVIPRFLGVGQWFRVRRKHKQLQRRIDELENEVVQLRNIPLDVDPRAPRRAGISESTHQHAGAGLEVTVSKVSARLGHHDLEDSEDELDVRLLSD